MVKFAATQSAFSAGEISPYIYGRSDLAVYSGALRECLNWIPDQFGSLHRRPGTEFVEQAKGKPCFYEFDAGPDCPAIISATGGCFRFFVDGVASGEISVPYAEEHICDLKLVDDCGATFIVHPAYRPRFVVKSGDTFALNDFPGLPFEDVNEDAGCKLILEAGGSGGTGSLTVISDAISTGDNIDISDGTNVIGSVVIGAYLGANTFEADYISIESGDYIIDGTGDAIRVQSSGAVLRAEGCEPFTNQMVGELVRILDENGTGGNEPNTWVTAQIIALTSSSEVVVAYDGPELVSTDLFCLPAYGDGVYPSAVWIHQDRLWFGKENCFVGSETGNFFSWQKTEADGSVVPTNAVYGKLDAGQCHAIQWMRTNGRYLVLGTDHAVYAVGGAQGGVAADDISQQLIQSVGSSSVDPVTVADETLFVDWTGTRIYTVAPGAQYDQLASVERTIFADHIGGRGIARMAFQEVPFPIVWVVDDHGGLSSLTYYSGQGVRAWSRHELGGSRIVGGCDVAPSVCDVSVQRGLDGKSEVVLMAVERTINGADVVFVEKLGEVFQHTTRQEDAHYLDAAVKVGRSLTAPSGLSWGAPSTGFSSPVEGRVAIADRERWYFGDASGGTLELDAPNTSVARPGRTLVDDGGWRRVAKARYGEPKEDVGPDCCLFDPPCEPLHYAVQSERVEGLEAFEGEALVAYVDGFDCGSHVVSAGAIDLPAAIGVVGFNYVSEFEPLSWRANLGVSDGAGDFSSTVRVLANVYRTASLKLVTAGDDYYRSAESVTEFVEAQSTRIWGREFFSGWVDLPSDVAVSRNDEAGYKIRADGPFPAIVRGFKTAQNAQVGL